MFHDSEGFIQLQCAYKEAERNSFGLYLGAGVNLPAGEVRPRYKTYSWIQLLEALYLENRKRLTISFSALCKKYKNDWPGMAEVLVGSLNARKLVEQIDKIIHNDIPRGDKDGRLSKRFLEQAPTLHAVICFSAKIRERTQTSWAFEGNPKIGIVITPNYDFFFGAGWTRYQGFKRQWKVQTPFSLEEPNARQRTINYIHGYIPYRFSKKKDLVLTQASYDAAYAPMGFARRTLNEAVRKYNLIFVGTSFSDPPLCEILQQVRGQEGVRHFAIVTSAMVKTAKKLGICPIEVNGYAQIKDVLKHIYCDAMDIRTWQRFGFEDHQTYWERLRLGPAK